MKNIILIIIGVSVIFLVLVTGFHVFSLQSRKNEMENHVSRVVTNTLEREFPTSDNDRVKKVLIEELCTSIGVNRNVSVDVQAIDMEKGIISVIVSESFRQMNGQWKTISCEKTAIMEQTMVKEEMVTVSFLMEDAVYKEYQIVQGEVCPTPKAPRGQFLGWKMDGSDEVVTQITDEIMEDTIYVAVME